MTEYDILYRQALRTMRVLMQSDLGPKIFQHKKLEKEVLTLCGILGKNQDLSDKYLNELRAEEKEQS